MGMYLIFMPNIAAKLIRKGFPIIKTEPNRKNPKYLVYFFENTLDFQIALQEILEK